MDNQQHPSKSFFITGIGTDVGKTVVSAVLVQALGADYLKPVQAGELEYTDTDRVKELVTTANPKHAGIFHPENYRLEYPLSPHISAHKMGVTIDPQNLILPETSNHLIVEGAGGLFVPLNNNFYVIDLIKKLQMPTIVVSRHYLGSINHTILTLEALLQHEIPIAAVIFNGDENPATESVIAQRFKAVSYYRIPQAPTSVTPEFILSQSEGILKFIHSCLIPITA